MLFSPWCQCIHADSCRSLCRFLRRLYVSPPEQQRSYDEEQRGVTASLSGTPGSSPGGGRAAGSLRGGGGGWGRPTAPKTGHTHTRGKFLIDFKISHYFYSVTLVSSSFKLKFDVWKFRLRRTRTSRLKDYFLSHAPFCQMSTTKKNNVKKT